MYPKWPNYDIITSLFQKNYGKLHLGIIDFSSSGNMSKTFKN